jgi:hypothetical protein
MRCFLALEEALPSSSAIEEFLQSVGPDVLVVSPLINAASYQVDYVKSAKSLGIATAVCIPSWDNLTNKGHIKTLPDQVIVWNHTQVREAADLHGVPLSRLRVTGAQPFDRWFGRTPSTSREEFCRKVGLAPNRPYVLFCGSRSNIGDGVEPAFVRRWIEAIRGDEAELDGDIGVLVRPHPERVDWRNESLNEFSNAEIWPRTVGNSIAPEARSDYFDSLYHAAAVVGINTSAMIEAAIVGRPVLTVLAPEFRESHDGTLHFRYLRPGHGGFLREAGTLEEHRRQLAHAVRDPRSAQEDNNRFVRTFIRPLGIEQPCTPILVDVVEQLGKNRYSAAQAGASLTARRATLRLLVRAVMAYDVAMHPRKVRMRAKRSSRALRRFAKKCRRHRRLAMASNGLADGVETLGVRASDRLKQQRRQKKAERAGDHRRVVQANARLLDPQRVDEGSRVPWAQMRSPLFDPAKR